MKEEPLPSDPEIRLQMLHVHTEWEMIAAKLLRTFLTEELETRAELEHSIDACDCRALVPWRPPISFYWVSLVEPVST